MFTNFSFSLSLSSVELINYDIKSSYMLKKLGFSGVTDCSVQLLNIWGSYCRFDTSWLMHHTMTTDVPFEWREYLLKIMQTWVCTLRLQLRSIFKHFTLIYYHCWSLLRCAIKVGLMNVAWTTPTYKTTKYNSSLHLFATLLRQQTNRKIFN